MVPKFFVGVDISKLTLDIALLAGKKQPLSFKIANSEKSILEFLKAIKVEYRIKNRDVIFCAEHMGIYSTFLLNVLVKKNISVYLESPLQIKRSLGLQRGKNDKVDAIRIAQYAEKHFNILRLWQPPRACVEELRILFATRRKLIKVKKMLINPEKINSYYLTPAKKKLNESYYLESQNSVMRDIDRIEKAMIKIIKSDDRLNALMEIVTSVPRIGQIIGIQFITYTNEFLDITTAKKFASFCGVAPFEYRSGTSVSGRTKVSHLGNKEVKAMLHMASMGFPNMPNSFLGKYYIRKVAEGKNKMSVLNAIRNKLIHRVYACVKSGVPYQEF